jgi:hypothetical protein
MAGEQPGRPAARCAALIRRRHFVDREPGVLLMWMPTDVAIRTELAELLPLAEARHPAARFVVRQAGAALVVSVAAGEAELGEIEATYVTGPLANPRAAADQR